MTEDTYDDFLQETILKIHNEWLLVGGRKLTPTEMQELNDKLDTFFSTKQD